MREWIDAYTSSIGAKCSTGSCSASTRRETREETGYASLIALQQICSVYPSPGGSSERIHICHAEIAIRDDAPQTAGNAGEGEDIRLVTLTSDDAIAKARDGQILDAKTLIALQWLELRT